MSDIPSLVVELSHHSEACIRLKTALYVLGNKADDSKVHALRREMAQSALVKTLLSERDADGQIPLEPYAKWRGAHWVLALLADLGYPRGDHDLIPLREQVYAWLFSARHEKAIAQRVVGGRQRWHASQEGNALYYLHALGLADERCGELARRLLQWQWPDGGWNCDMRPGADTSSFMETLIPLRGLVLHAREGGDCVAAAAAARALEVFLSRRLYKRRQDGEVIKSDFVALHYPCYWHYDILFGLKVINEAGCLADERCGDALALLASRQLPGGGFLAEKKYYRVGKGRQAGASLVDWGGTSKRVMNPFVTVDALCVLKAAGRL